MCTPMGMIVLTCLPNNMPFKLRPEDTTSVNIDEALIGRQ
jgi:hypothetical protein